MSAVHTTGSGSHNPWMQWMSGFAQMAQGPAGQVYKEWEGWFAGQIERVVRSETFLGQVAKTLESSFAMKRMADRVMEASVKAMRLPSVGDLDALVQRVDELERRVASVVEGLETPTRAVEAQTKATRAATEKATDGSAKSPAKKAKKA